MDNSARRQELRARAAKLWWFNAIDFGDFQSRGRDKPDAPPNASLYGTFDLLSSLNLKGMRCIDIGAGSGVVALGMKALGAEYVAAVDTKRYEVVEIARELTGEDIDYRIIPVEKLRHEENWHHSFDVVVSSGLLYHLLSPFELIYVARKLLKNNGLFVLQTLIQPEPEDAKAGMFLNTAVNINSDPTTFFVPSPSCVRGLLRAGCFDPIAQRSLVYKAAFSAWLSIAKSKPEEVSGRTKNLTQMHEWHFGLGENFGGYDLRNMLEAKSTSAIGAVNIEAHKLIDEHKRKAKFPYNPANLTDAVGHIR